MQRNHQYLIFLLSLAVIQCSSLIENDEHYEVYDEVHPLNIIDIDGNNLKELSERDFARRFLYSMNDENIFNMDGDDIYHFNLNTLENEHIKSLKIDGIRDRLVSPNGDIVVFVANNGVGDTYYKVDIYAVDLNGNNLRNLTNTPNIMEASPSFSVDGNKLIFVTKSDAVNLDLPDDEGQTISYYDFELDTTLRIIRHKNDFTVGYTTHGVLFGKHYYYPHFGINNDQIYFLKRSEIPGDSLINYNIPTGESNNLAIDAWKTQPLYISNLRNQLVYNGSNDLLVSIDTDGSNKTVLYDSYFTYGCNFTENGEKIVYWSEHYDNDPIYIIDRNGADRIKLPQGQNAVFTNSGEKIVFIGYKKLQY